MSSDGWSDGEKAWMRGECVGPCNSIWSDGEDTHSHGAPGDIVDCDCVAPYGPTRHTVELEESVSVIVGLLEYLMPPEPVYQRPMRYVPPEHKHLMAHTEQAFRDRHDRWVAARATLDRLKEMNK